MNQHGTRRAGTHTTHTSRYRVLLGRVTVFTPRGAPPPARRAERGKAPERDSENEIRKDVYDSSQYSLEQYEDSRSVIGL